MDPLQKIEDRFPDWHYDHPRILYALIRAMKPEVCVEVGTYRGYAACYIAEALRKNGKGHLYCIDDWSLTEHQHIYGDAKDHFIGNITHCGYEDLITVIEGNSFDVDWPEKVDFAYIDGWHSYAMVTEDFKRAATQGATVMCFDDVIGTIGPRMLMDELRGSENWGVSIIDSDGGLGIVTRMDTRRKVKFGQEFDMPNTGTQLHEMTKGQQQDYFLEHHIPTKYLEETESNETP